MTVSRGLHYIPANKLMCVFAFHPGEMLLCMFLWELFHDWPHVGLGKELSFIYWWILFYSANDLNEVLFSKDPTKNQHRSTAAVAGGGAWDVTCLLPQVCFLFSYFILLYLHLCSLRSHDLMSCLYDHMKLIMFCLGLGKKL